MKRDTTEQTGGKIFIPRLEVAFVCWCYLEYSIHASH